VAALAVGCAQGDQGGAAAGALALSRLRRAGTVEVLQVDPDLGRHIGPAQAMVARERLTASSFALAPGRWEPPLRADQPTDLGYLMVDGLLVRRLQVAGRAASELLTAGSLLRPWQQHEHGSLPMQAAWRVLRPTRLVLLCERFQMDASRFPGVLAELQARSVERSRELAALLAIVQEPRLEARLIAVFALLADRMGRRTREGVVVPLPLSQQALGEVIGASRARTCEALRRLQARGALVRRTDPTWLLCEHPGSSLSSQVA